MRPANELGRAMDRGNSRFTARLLAGGGEPGDVERLRLPELRNLEAATNLPGAASFLVRGRRYRVEAIPGAEGLRLYRIQLRMAVVQTRAAALASRVSKAAEGGPAEDGWAGALAESDALSEELSRLLSEAASILSRLARPAGRLARVAWTLGLGRRWARKLSEMEIGDLVGFCSRLRTTSTVRTSFASTPRGPSL